MTGVPSFIGTIHLIRTLSYARPPPAAPAKRVSWGMKRADLLDNLAHVERHVRDGERHLLRQREIVDGLERYGRGQSETAKMARVHLGII